MDFVWILLVAVAVVGVAAYLVRTRARPVPEPASSLSELSRDALTIVDLVTPAGTGGDAPSTVEITSVIQRINDLDRRLENFDIGRSAEYVLESIGDVRRVSMDLGAALEAERSLRVAAAKRSPADVEASRARIAKRVAELDLASRELAWQAASTRKKRD